MAKLGKNKLATVSKKQSDKGTLNIKSGSSVKDVVSKAATPATPAKTKTKGTGSSLALKPTTTTTATTTTEGDAAATPNKSIAQKLSELEATQRAEIAKKKEDQAKALGRSDDASRRVSSSTRISGLRGLEPRLGMQFYKKKTEE